MIFVIVGLIIVLLLVAAVRPRSSQLSDFELQRLCEEKDQQALFDWRRQQLLADVGTWRRILEMLLLVVVVGLLIIRYQPGLGIGLGLLLALIYPVVAAWGLVRALPQRIYDRYEVAILDAVESISGLTKLLRRHDPANREEPLPASRQELQYIISRSADLLESDERKIIAGAFDFADKLVKDYMTPRSSMEVIGANEMLGPLVLDDLHKTGHSHFPVLDGDIDHIVGILHLHNLLVLTKKETVTVREAMEPKVLFIHEDQTLNEALSACIKYRRHLLVVVNEFRETVGVITIEDAVKQLLGREIVDQYDDHDNLQKVAERNPIPEDQPAKTSDD